VAVVSGRALADIRHHVALKELIYVGNHGFEIDGPDIHFESICSPEINSLLDRVKAELTAAFSKIEGVLIEDKGLTISLHYRLVSVENIPLVQKTFETVCKVYEQQKQIVVFTGKKVIEIRPPILWNKGTAVMWLLKKYKIALGKNSPCVYVGDDTTDEDAFESLKDIGVTVVVGGDPSIQSKAGYFVNNTQEVTAFLKDMLEFVEVRC
jgi:trehalose 6-phosphate phosphatase